MVVPHNLCFNFLEFTRASIEGQNIVGCCAWHWGRNAKFHPLRLFLPPWPPVTLGKGTQAVCDSVSVLPWKEEQTVGHGHLECGDLVFWHFSESLELNRSL